MLWPVSQLKLYYKVLPVWIGKHQKWEAEGMESIIGLWRSEVINCGEIGGLKRFAGRSSESIWLVWRWWEKLPAEHWKELLCMICSVLNRCFLIFFFFFFLLHCHQTDMTHQHLHKAVSGSNPLFLACVSCFVVNCKMNFWNVTKTPFFF